MHLLVPMALILAMPLAGVFLAGRPVTPYLAFPPKPMILEHAPFSPAAFLIIALFIKVFTHPLVRKGLGYKPEPPSPGHSPLPWWGFAATGGLAVFLCLAWTRFDWFAPLQAHTFFPIWLSWIITVNALIQRKTGQCPMLDSPKRFTRLFLVSTGFWWLFEYLNRFVGNWYYTGSEYGPVTYFLLASLSFSTVLPAVESMKAWLLTFDRFRNGFKKGFPLPLPATRSQGLALAVAAALPLGFMGLFPDQTFFLVWICPFFIFLGIRIALGRPHIFQPAGTGDLTQVTAYATAALVCGFFWELFNIHSLAKWEYSIPYVQVLHIFEMPVLGYAGYLPFGLECAIIIDTFTEKK